MAQRQGAILPLDWKSAIGPLEATLRWASAAMGPAETTLHLHLPDRAGRLRRVLSTGVPRDVDAGAGVRRRRALSDRRNARVDLGRTDGLHLALLPVLSHGRAIGVLEVVAPGAALDERWAVLETIAGQAGVVFPGVGSAADPWPEEDLLVRAARVTRGMVRASSRRDATRSALRFYHELVRHPIAAWVSRDSEPTVQFAGGMGLGSRKRDRLSEELGAIPRWALLTRPGRQELRDRFAQIVGQNDVVVADLDDAILMSVGGAPSQASLDAVGALLAEALRRVATVVMAEQGNERLSERLNMGIAWTAHEFRSPLLAAMAAVERLLGSEDALDRRSLLKQTSRQLKQLSGMVDEVLRLGAEAGRPRLRPRDLVRMVNAAVESCRLQAEGRRFVLEMPDRVVVRAEARQLQAAVANVIRNAVDYSPPWGTVTIRVAVAGGAVVVDVEDQGIGIPESEREVIFDPLTRGSAAVSSSHRGTGLGLFIARRVVEAHGGSIWVESQGGHGSTFHLRLPVGDGQDPSHLSPTPRVVPTLSLVHTS